MAKKRLDQLLVERGLAESRTRAQALIMAGKVMVGEKLVDKAGQQVVDDAAIALKGSDHPWVSRGGIKLDHALTHFGLDVTGLVAMDVGSSTGGFTDVLLQRGAARVYAVDSGTNQLAWRLRSDPRVIVHEQTSARILTAEHIPEPIGIIVCDASFIGLAKVLERPLGFAAPGALLAALIKPQFEAAGRKWARAAWCAIPPCMSASATRCAPGSKRSRAGTYRASPPAPSPGRRAMWSSSSPRGTRARPLRVHAILPCATGCFSANQGARTGGVGLEMIAIARRRS